MAHRTTYHLRTPRSEVDFIVGKMTGAAAASMVYVEGDVLSATWTATGTFNLVFKHKYPQGLLPLDPGVVGTTTGLGATFTAWNPAAGTATVKFSVGAAATNPAATDTVYFGFLVRNSGRN